MPSFFYIFSYNLDDMQLKSTFKKLKHLVNGVLGSADIALDLGTSLTRLGISTKGVVLREPSYIGQNTRTGDFLFFGTEAKEIYGKAPNFIQISRPVEHSIISDFDKTVLLLKHFMDKAVYPFFLNRTILKNKLYGYAVVPTSSTEVEQKATIEALAKVGISDTYLIEKPLAAACGAGLSVFSKNPYFIIDLGGGSVAIAYSPSGSEVVATSYSTFIHELQHVLFWRLTGDGDADHASGDGPWTEQTAVAPLIEAFEATAPACQLAQ